MHNGTDKRESRMVKSVLIGLVYAKRNLKSQFFFFTSHSQLTALQYRKSDGKDSWLNLFE